jgi:mannose-6-phosphate isomerase-like protein (cupin superfamily)
MPGVAITPDGGEHLGTGVRSHRVLCELPDLEVVDLRFGPEFEGVDLHTHGDHTDAFFVLEGLAEFTLDGELHRFGPGGFVAVPRGTVHGFRNVGPGNLRLLNVHAPTTGFIQSLRG